jgi:hypothetical protein
VSTVPQPQDKLDSKPDNDGHYSVTQLIKRARAIHSEKYHWDALDIDVLIRPRTHAENADGARKVQTLNALMAEEPDAAAYMRVELETTLPCVLWPDGTPVFQPDDIDAVMDIDTPSLNELRDKVSEVSLWNEEKAKTVGEGSGETGEDKPSSDSPETAETITSEPTPIRSTPS